MALDFCALVFELRMRPVSLLSLVVLLSMMVSGGRVSAQDAGVLDADDAGQVGDAATQDAGPEFIPGPWSPMRQAEEPTAAPSFELRAVVPVAVDLPNPEVGSVLDAGAATAVAFADAAVLFETPAPPAGEGPSRASDPGEAGAVWSEPVATVDETTDLSDLVSVVVDEEHGPAGYWGWLILTLILALIAWLFDRALRKRASRFTESGLFPSLLSIAALLWRGALLLAFVFVVLEALPPAWLPDLKWVVFGAFLVALWALRGVLSDLVARVVIAIDGKVRPRLMVQTDGLTGRIARVGPRQTDVVDPIGRTWALPNRLLLSAQVREPSEAHVHASLALELDDKSLLEDAALSSAWIHPNAVVHVWRDASDTHLWHVETELISNDFERVFRSDLAERVRERVREQERSTRVDSVLPTAEQKQEPQVNESDDSD